jgi:hypothetical protein
MKQLLKGFLIKTLSFTLLCTFSCVYAQNTELDQVNETLSNITSVVVDGSFCNVTIKSHSDNTVIFKAELKGSSNMTGAKVKYSTENSVLHIWLDIPKDLWNNISGKIELMVPANTIITVNNSSGSVFVNGIGNANVSVQTSSGSIKVDQVDSNLRCQSSSGSQNILNITGTLKTSTSSGSQNISNIGQGVETLASSGSIDINNVKGNVSAQTSSGSISVSDVTGNVEVKATSGSINTNNIQGDLRGNTSSGSIQLNNIKGSLTLGSSSGSQSGNSIQLTGNSSFQSSSGSIHMQLTNDASELSFSLRASSGGLNAKGIKGSHELDIEKGSIKITGNSSSGSQTYQ